MTNILPAGIEAPLAAGAGNASTVDNATVVRILNDSGSIVIVTRLDNDDATILGTFSMLNNTSEMVEKRPSEKLFVDGGNVKVAKVGYTN